MLAKATNINIYDYLRGKEDEEEEKEKKEEEKDEEKAVASYITYCKANYQNKLNIKIRKSFEKSDTHFQKCRFNKASEGDILFMDVFTFELLQQYQYMEIKSITLAKTPIRNKQTGVQLALHVYLIINIEDAIVLSPAEMDEISKSGTEEEKERKLYGDDRYTPAFHEFLSKKYAEKYKKEGRVCLIIERHERVGIEYYFQRAEETHLTIDFSMSNKLKNIRHDMRQFLQPTKIMEILPTFPFPSFPFKIILGEFINNAIVYYTMSLGGRMPYGMGLITFWSKYSLAENNCQLFAFSCLHANFLLPSEDEVYFLTDIVGDEETSLKQAQLEKYCTELNTFYEGNMISLVKTLIPTTVIQGYGGPTSPKDDSRMLYTNSTFVAADEDDKKCIIDCYKSTPKCVEECHIEMFTKVECVISKALSILLSKMLNKPPPQLDLFLEKCDKTHLVARIKELENDAFTSALKNCKSKKKELSAKFNETTLSNDVSCFKKHKTKKR